MPVHTIDDKQKNSMSKTKKVKTTTKSIRKSSIIGDTSQSFQYNGHLFMLNYTNFNIYCAECNVFNCSILSNYFECQNCKMTLDSEHTSNKLPTNITNCISNQVYKYSHSIYIKELLLWNTDDIIFWLLSFNLDQLVNFVKHNKFNGTEISDWNISKLENYSNIPNKRYLECLDKAIKLLKLKQPKKPNENDIYHKTTKSSNSHKIILWNFDQNINCVDCNIELIGLQQQGYICKNCYICIHKCCINFISGNCNKSLKSSIITDKNIVFKRGELNIHFDWLKKCLKYLSLRPKKYILNFKSYSSDMSYNKLYQIIIQDKSGDIFQTDDDINLFASIDLIKDFLLSYSSEIFPNSILNNLYQMQIEKRYAEFDEYVKNIDNDHFELLEIFTKHIIKMEKRKIDSSKLIEMYGKYIIRPTDYDILDEDIIEKKCNKLFEAIIICIRLENQKYSYENNIEDYHSSEMIVDPIIEAQTYFYNTLTPKELNDLFINENNGNFVVSISKSNNSYELIVAMNGKPKFILIMNTNNRYYITKGINFYCIIDIIEYHQKNGFGSEFSNLERKLREPVYIPNKKTNVKKLNVNKLRSKLSIAKENRDKIKIKLDKLISKYESNNKILKCIEKIEFFLNEHEKENNDNCINKLNTRIDKMTIKKNETILNKILTNFNIDFNGHKSFDNKLSKTMKEFNDEFERINIYINTLNDVILQASGEKEQKQLDNLYDQLKISFVENKKPRKSK